MVRNTVPAPKYTDEEYLRSISKTIGVDYDSLDEDTAQKLSEFYSGSTPKRREAVEATKRKNED